jgi:hypothetical protein
MNIFIINIIIHDICILYIGLLFLWWWCNNIHQVFKEENLLSNICFFIYIIGFSITLFIGYYIIYYTDKLSIILCIYIQHFSMMLGGIYILFIYKPKKRK